MTSAIERPVWAVPRASVPTAGAVIGSALLATFSFVISAFGFALPMALHLVDSGRALGRPEDVALLRSVAPEGWLITVVGLVHGAVGLGLLGGWRTASGGALVLAGSGAVVACVVLLASVARWGPFAGTGFARPGSPRMDGIAITLAVLLFEAMVIAAAGSARREDPRAG